MNWMHQHNVFFYMGIELLIKSDDRVFYEKNLIAQYLHTSPEWLCSGSDMLQSWPHPNH